MKLSALLLVFLAFCCNQTILAQKAAQEPYDVHKHMMDSLDAQSKSDYTFNGYIDAYFQQKELAQTITCDVSYVLYNYYNWGYGLYLNKLYKESNENFKAYFTYYNSRRKQLPPDFDSGSLYLRNLMRRIMALNCYDMGYPADSVKHYFNEAIKTVKGKDAYLHAATINDLGFYLMKTGHANEALALYKTALNILNRQKCNDDLIRSVRNYMADIYYKQGHYQEALTYYQANFHLYKTAGPRHAISPKLNAEQLPGTAAKTILTLLKLGQPQSAKAQLNIAYNLLSAKNVQLAAWPQKQIELLSAEQALLTSMQQHRQALQKATQIRRIHDSLSKHKDTTEVQFERKRSEYQLASAQQLFELKKEIAEEKIITLRYKMYLMAIIGLAALLFIGLLYKRYRKQKQLNFAMRKTLTQFARRIEAQSQTMPETEREGKLNQLFESYDLSKREIDILEALADKMTNAQIAEQLYISPNTVKFHLKNIYTKLDIKSREEFYHKAQLKQT